jgi:hypothetical protein
VLRIEANVDELVQLMLLFLFLPLLLLLRRLLLLLHVIPTDVNGCVGNPCVVGQQPPVKRHLH